MRILVTGGAGFIGSHIVDRYIDLGHKVVVLDDLSTGQKRLINPRAVFYETDIRDKKKLAEIFAKEKPEVINHHAAQMDVRKSVADPRFDAEVNILGLINLLEEGRRVGIKKIIFASTGGAIYGDAAVLPTPEDYPCQPASPYGISKLSSEYYLNFYKQAYGLTSIILRYGNVYGPRQNPHGEAGVVAIFCQKMLKREQPVINGDGKQSRDFVYVEDVAAANVAGLTHNESITVNIGTGITTSVNTLFRELTKLTATKFKETHGPVKLGEQQMSLLDIRRAKVKLGWQSKTSLSAGLAKTVAFFQHEAQ